VVSKAGDTFTFTLDGNHLWIALTTPEGSAGSFIAVNLTSVKNGRPIDDTCIIEPGEHPWVRKQTEVYYMKAREWQVSGFDSLASYGENCTAEKPASKALLLKIQKGALASPHTKDRFIEDIRKAMGS